MIHLVIRTFYCVALLWGGTVCVWSQDKVDFHFSGKPVYIESIEISDERKKDHWSGRVGLGMSYTPDYMGANTSSAISALDFKASWNDRIFIENNKIGAVLVNKRLYKLGVIGRVRLERDELNGTGQNRFDHIDEAVEVGIFAGTSLYKLFLTGEMYLDVSNVHSGAALELEAGYTFEMNSRFSLTPIVGASWGDRDYIKTYFGASDELRAQYAQFEAKSGFFEYFAEAALEYRLGRKWLIKSSVRYSRLSGSAGNSPLVSSALGSKNQASGFMALIWLF